MGEDRVRIADIAEELGLSTATVSNVIHGKTERVSDETVKQVQALIEKRGYIPSMAGILLAQNDSRIIGVVINDHEKYEGRVLEDGFISSAVNTLLREIDRAGYFMMLKTTEKWDDIVRFASMWNMEGLVLMGFCEQDYKKLRESMHIPFVVYDGYFRETPKVCNLTLDNYDGGYQVGTYLKRLGHEKVLCLADNHICMDGERMDGCADAIGRAAVHFLQIPMKREDRMPFYQARIQEIMGYTAVFAASDFYAVELMHFLEKQGIHVPEEISIVGFDDSFYCLQTVPELTSVRQDVSLRARNAIEILRTLRSGGDAPEVVKLPVSLVVRQSAGEPRREGR